MSEYYRLDGKTVVPCSLYEWALNFENSDARRVALTQLDGARISTVFLGSDHNFGGDVPHIFETMVFSEYEAIDQETDRYPTWEAAEAGHAAMVERMRSFLAARLDGIAIISDAVNVIG